MDDTELQKLAIERYVAGELGPEASGRLAAHCETCADCGRYLKQLRREQDGFLDEHPYAQFKRRISAECGRKPMRGFFVNLLRRPALAPAVGVLATLLVFLPIALNRMALVGPGKEILYKGGPQLSFLLKRDGTISPGDRNGAFFAGDEIQVLYSAQGKRHISLMSVDSRGMISMYNPDTNGTACSVPALTGSNRPYPASIRLDNSKGVEMVFALLSDRPLKTDEVKQWILSAFDNGMPDANQLPRRLEAIKGKLGVRVLTLVLHKG